MRSSFILLFFIKITNSKSSPPQPRPVVAFGVTPQNAVAKGEAPLKRGRGRDPVYPANGDGSP